MPSWLAPKSVPPRLGSIYPAPFDNPLAGRAKRAREDARHLTQFGVNLVTLAPGAWSSQRHWHTNEDEFVYILEDEATLVTDAGATVLGYGAGFPAAGPTDTIWSTGATSPSSTSKSAPVPRRRRRNMATWK